MMAGNAAEGRGSAAESGKNCRAFQRRGRSGGKFRPRCRGGEKARRRILDAGVGISTG